MEHPVKGADAVCFFKQGLTERVKTAIAVYGDDDLDTLVVQAKRVDAAFRTSHTPAPIVRGYGHAGGPKRSSVSVSTGDNKRAKATTGITSELITHRTGERRCSNCGLPQLAHKIIGPMGKHCPNLKSFAEATGDEKKAMKGKGQA